MLQSGVHFGDLDQPLFAIYGQEIPIFLILGVVLAVAEVILTRKKGVWRGLVLPGVFFLWAVVKCAARAVLYHPVVDDLCFALCVENIPTLWLLAVYVVCRVWQWRRVARQAEGDRSIDKTRIDDL